jgi:PTH1 family peptidyl-tRNA hydrolase
LLKKSNPGKKPTLVIIGLGNPGQRYTETRHNAGFWILQALADTLGIRLKKVLWKKLQIGRIELDGDFLFSQLVLVKPLTYMNRSGDILPVVEKEIGSALPDKHGVPSTDPGLSEETIFIIIVDNMDLVPGRLRMKMKGGTAGHNGLKSVSDYLGRNFVPLYVGIGRPHSEQTVIDYVLGVPEAAERKAHEDAISRGVRGIELLLKDFNNGLQFLNEPDR